MRTTANIINTEGVTWHVDIGQIAEDKKAEEWMDEKAKRIGK